MAAALDVHVAARRGASAAAACIACGRHQPVAAAGQPQAGHRQRRQARRAGRCPAAGARPSRERVRAPARRARTLAARSRRISSRTWSEPCASSTRKRSMVRAVVARQFVGEAAEHAVVHALRPVVGAHEARAGAQHRQAAHRRRVALRRAAARPGRRATSPATAPAACARRSSRAHGIERRAAARCRALRPCPGRSTRCRVKCRCEPRDQRREHAAVHGPAVQHAPAPGRCRRCSICNSGIGACGVLADAPRAPCTSASTSRSLCSALSVMRRRAWPSGTVGGRIAPTRKPRACSARRQRPARARCRRTAPAGSACTIRSSGTPARRRRAPEAHHQRRQLGAAPGFAADQPQRRRASRRPCAGGGAVVNRYGPRGFGNVLDQGLAAEQHRALAAEAPCPAAPAAAALRPAPRLATATLPRPSGPSTPMPCASSTYSSASWLRATSARSRSGAMSPSMLKTPSVASMRGAVALAASAGASRASASPVRIALAARSRPGARRRSGRRG